jgi:hypothetical protein
VTFGTAAADETSAACQAVARWSVPRQRPDAAVVVSDDGLRLEERDPTSGEVVRHHATTHDAAALPVGARVTEVPAAPADCGPEDPATDPPTSTIVG